nr:immunoglobulin heavy chain junction region [Mus musculus]
CARGAGYYYAMDYW